MKRLLSLLFLVAGLAIAHSAHAQTEKPKKKKATKKEQTESGNPAEITIDENGQSRPTKGKSQSTNPGSGGSDTTSTPKEAPKSSAGSGSAQKTEASPPPAPSPEPITIDENGSARTPRASGSKPGEQSKPIGDTAIIGPSQQVERPKK